MEKINFNKEIENEDIMKDDLETASLNKNKHIKDLELSKISNKNLKYVIYILSSIIAICFLCLINLLNSIYSNKNNNFNVLLIYQKIYEKYLMNINNDNTFGFTKQINEFINKLNNLSYDSFFNTFNFSSSPEISIIVPVYNGGKYISKLLKSLRLQSFTNYEVILMDDKSTDDTYKILLDEAKKDKRIKVFQNIKNSGTLTTRYNGFKHSTGKYISFFDQDDFYSMEDSLLIIYNTMILKNTDIIEFCTVYLNKKFKYNKKNYKCPSKNMIKNTISELDYSCILWVKLFKREILNKVYLKLGNKVLKRAINGEDLLVSAVLFKEIKSYYPLKIPIHLKKNDGKGESSIYGKSQLKSELNIKEQKEFINVANILYDIFDVYDENDKDKPFFNIAIKYYFKNGFNANVIKKYPNVQKAYENTCKKLISKKNILDSDVYCKKILNI